MLSKSQSQTISLKPFLNHYGETTDEQIERNQAAIELIKDWLSEDISASELAERKSYLAALKQTIDSQRLPDDRYITDR